MVMVFFGTKKKVLTVGCQRNSRERKSRPNRPMWSIPRNFLLLLLFVYFLFIPGTPVGPRGVTGLAWLRPWYWYLAFFSLGFKIWKKVYVCKYRNFGVKNFPWNWIRYSFMYFISKTRQINGQMKWFHGFFLDIFWEFNSYGKCSKIFFSWNRFSSSIWFHEFW